LTIAGVCCWVGSYYAYRTAYWNGMFPNALRDGYKENRNAEAWALALMLMGLVFIGCATGPWWMTE
jgi:hypothetical protein